mgnify:FL=1
MKERFVNMKATGIVRRIDDLGRVIIPKEIRRTMRLREGDPMEIYIHDGAVCFKKYDASQVPLDVLSDLKSLIDDKINDITKNADKQKAIYDKLRDLEDLLRDSKDDE